MHQHLQEAKTEWWENGFEAEWSQVYAYKKQDTRQEVEGIIHLLGLPVGSRILDVGCGSGRITIPLARQGYRLTGLDYSAALLKTARQRAARSGVEIDWIQGDMRRMRLRYTFDAVISIFTSFGYFNDPQKDLQTLISMRKALKKNGKLILDLENPDLVLKQIEGQAGQPVLSALDKRGNQVETITSYDKNTKRVTLRLKLLPPKNLENSQNDPSHQSCNAFESHTARQIQASHRLYSLPEIKDLLEKAGLQVQAVFGDFSLIDFNKNNPRLLLLITRINSEQIKIQK